MSRRAWWGVLVGIAVLIAVLVWARLWFVRWIADEERHAGAQRVLAVVRAAASAPRADAAQAPAFAPSGAPGAEQIELCGGRWFTLNPDGSADNDAFERAIGLPDARAAMMSALRTDPSEYARAVAMRLAMADSAQAGENLDALVRLATTTTDPRVYALAFGACGKGSPGAAGVCRLLNAPQWARLDPGNAAPWISVLGAAVVQHDAPGQVEALYHIAHSARQDDRFLALTAEVLAHLPSDDTALPATLALTVEAAGLDAAQVLPAYQNLTQMCRGAALDDANRREACSGAAELLFSQADTLIAARIGGVIGRQLGWPAERLDQARGESTAYLQSTLVKDPAAPRNACTDMRQSLTEFQSRARLGEAGAVRDWVARSGLQPEDFIRIERDERAQRAAEAASAASAAAAASAASAPR
ncbi:MAG TPA: hypothetical protein VGM74_13750 [Burkholderiaceae bacterium]